MKRISVLAIALCLVLTACGSTAPEKSAEITAPKQTDTVAEVTVPQEAPTIVPRTGLNSTVSEETAQPFTAAEQAAEPEGKSEQWDDIGRVSLTPMTDWVQRRNEDTLADKGSYGACYTWGQGVSSIATDGNTVRSYPGQISLLLQYHDNAAAAQAAADQWEAQARQQYSIGKETAWPCAGVDYKLIAYTCTGADGGSRSGIFAVGVRNGLAIRADLSHTDAFTGSKLDTIITFLDGFNFD